MSRCRESARAVDEVESLQIGLSKGLRPSPYGRRHLHSLAATPSISHVTIAEGRSAHLKNRCITSYGQRQWKIDICVF
jgi:hypothetical protein